MTNNEFWNALELYAKTAQYKIPGLLLQAHKENLSVLVVSSDGNLNTLQVQEKLFAHLVTRRNAEVPDGCIVGETKLEGFFFDLIDSGYNGMAFTIDEMLIGIEWSDLFPAKPGKAKKKRRNTGFSV